MDDIAINKRFGFDSFLTEEERQAEVGIAIADGNLYYDITTPVKNALTREVGKFEARRWYSEIYKNIWFALQVGDKGDWNLKYRKGDGGKWESTLGIPFWGHQTEMFLDGHKVIVEDVGNITYGYLGSAIGFSQFWLNVGSSLNHFKNHGTNNWENEYADQANFAIGIDWYNTSRFRQKKR